MNQYNFEYTRQGFTYFLFGTSFAIIGLGIFFFRMFFKSYLSPGLAVIAIIGFAIGFFFINKHKIKRLSVAKLSLNDLTIEWNPPIHVSFAELKYYYIYISKNIVVFTLGLKDGTKFKLEANSNFCNEDLLKTFLADFQLNVKNYNEQNSAGIIHLETIFARKQTVYILSLLTICVILGFCFTKMPLMILPIALSVSLLAGWIRYFQQRNKNKLVDF